MRPDTLIALPHKAEFWDFNVSQNEAGEIARDYFKSKDISGMVTESDGSHVIFSRERLKFNGQLRNLRDSSGQPVFDLVDPVKYVFVGRSTPQFDVFGNVMGYRCALVVVEATP